jgi:putative peptidoglycan lipid II flippase
MLVLALGAQVALTVAGAEIAAVIYGSRLLPGQHAAIGLALALMGLGLWAWAAQTVLARGFYALGKTWIPSLLGTAVVAVVWPVYGLLGGWLGTAGLAAASTIGISTYVLALGFFLRREYRPARDGFGAFALRAAPAVVAGIGAGFGARAALLALVPGGAAGALDAALIGTPLSVGAHTIGALVQGGGLAALGLGTYLLAARAARVPGLAEVQGMVLRRFRRRQGAA